MKRAYTKPVLYVMICSISLAWKCNKNDPDSESTTGNWSVAADFKGDPRSDAAVFVIGDNAYVLTGTNDRGPFNDMYVYDANNGNWTKKAPLAGNARTAAVAFAINGKGYVGTGYNGDVDLRDFWEYDPGTDTWTQKDALPGDARHDAVAFAINGKGYVCGGYATRAYNDCWEFDPSQPAGSQWKEKAGFPHKTSAAAAFVLNNKGYIVTGTNNAEIQKELYQFDPTVSSGGQWTTKRALYNYSSDSYDDHYTSIIRQNAVAFVVSGRAFLATGQNGGYAASTWGYDADADTWKEYTGFEAKPREGAAAFTVKNRAFVLTGKTGTLYLDNMFEFSPDAVKVDGD